eukprot:jgi/Undpi1/8829/HiC_scaffold_25.g11291.m1
MDLPGASRVVQSPLASQGGLISHTKVSRARLRVFFSSICLRPSVSISCGVLALLLLFRRSSVFQATFEAVFPDKTFQKRESFTVPAVSFIFCTLSYWSIPWILVAHARSIPSWYQCSTTALFCAGMFMMHVSDFQKTLTLKLAPGTLITTGFYKHVRHPNFLGEIIIYISFAMLTGTAWGFLPVIASLALVLLPSMSRVDKSLSRYPEFAAWEASTYHVIPFIY